MRRRVAVAIIGWGVATAATAGEPARVAPSAPVRALPSDLRMARVPVSTPARVRLDDPQGRLRRGFGGSLVDLFPFATSRFHLSAGGRLFARPRASRALDERGLLAVPRGGGGWRGRRFAPALLMGVDRPAGGGVSLGIDAGVVMGAAMDRVRSPHGFRRGGGGGMPTGPNGVARVTMGVRF